MATSRHLKRSNSHNTHKNTDKWRIQLDNPLLNNCLAWEMSKRQHKKYRQKKKRKKRRTEKRWKETWRDIWAAQKTQGRTNPIYIYGIIKTKDIHRERTQKNTYYGAQKIIK